MLQVVSEIAGILHLDAVAFNLGLSGFEKSGVDALLG